MRKSFFTLSEVLEGIFKEKDSALSAGYFVHQLVRLWPEIAGEEIAKTGRPVQFKNQELTIALPSSSHLNEMHFIKETLRYKINKKFPERKIKKIILRVEDSSVRSTNKDLPFLK